MKSNKSLRILSIILLLLNGIPALLAGGNLMLDPTGAGLRMEVSILQTSPFTDFLIPGIILFMANGLLSIFTLALILSRNKMYPVFIIIQGIVLTGWIAIQILLITEPSWLQLAYGFAGLILTISGMTIDNRKKKQRIKERHTSIYPPGTQQGQAA